jgi:hypothetical protein
MEKEHQKRGNKAYTGSPTLIYMTSCREVKGKHIDMGSYPFSYDVKEEEREIS